MEDHKHELKDKFDKMNFEIGKMEDRAYSTINGIMSAIGVGLGWL